MNQLLISCYSSNFENYSHLLACMEAAGGVGAELAVSPEKPGFNQRLLLAEASFSGYPLSFHGPFEAVEPTSSEDSDGQRLLLAAYTETFDLCRRFHARYTVMHTNQCLVTEEARPALQRAALSSIRAVAAMACRAGVTLLVENVGEPEYDSVLFRQEEFLRLFPAAPQAGALLDVGHALLNRWDLERVLAALSLRLRALHLHSNDGLTDLHWPISCGVLDVKALCSLIKRYAPQADLVLEYAPGADIQPQLFRDDCRLLRWLLA